MRWQVNRVLRPKTGLGLARWRHYSIGLNKNMSPGGFSVCNPDEGGRQRKISVRYFQFSSNNFIVNLEFKCFEEFFSFFYANVLGF